MNINISTTACLYGYPQSELYLYIYKRSQQNSTTFPNKVLIGVLYAIFYLCSAVGTANSHRLKACVAERLLR